MEVQQSIRVVNEKFWIVKLDAEILVGFFTLRSVGLKCTTTSIKENTRKDSDNLIIDLYPSTSM